MSTVTAMPQAGHRPATDAAGPSVEQTTCCVVGARRDRAGPAAGAAGRRRHPARTAQGFRRQSILQCRLVAQASNPAKPFTAPPLLRVPVLRHPVAQFIAFGIWPVHVKG